MMSLDSLGDTGHRPAELAVSQEPQTLSPDHPGLCGLMVSIAVSRIFEDQDPSTPIRVAYPVDSMGVASQSCVQD